MRDRDRNMLRSIEDHSGDAPVVGGNNQPQIGSEAVVRACIEESSRVGVVKDYLTLSKPEITFLVTLSALAGFLLGSTESINESRLLWALIGIPITSAGGAMLNHFRELHFDLHMKRTAMRPLPSGRISPDTARWVGYVLVAAGLGILCPLTNPLTGVLGALAVALYLYVYTPLKRITPYNTLVGTIPGALPALGGWTAATGSLGPGGWAIFAILVFWQMPHFMSLAWMYRKDYEHGGFKMWACNDPSGTRTKMIISVFSGLMIIASLIPTFLGLSGLIYFFGALALGTWFVLPVVRFVRHASNVNARRVLKASVMYIPLLLLFIVLDGLI